MRRGTLSDAVRLALGGTLLLGASSGTAVAQDQDEDPAQLDRISITGSRIKRPDIESASPLFIIEREEIDRTGLTSVGSLMQDLTISGSAINTQFNNGGNGETNLDLRNLGPQRVLVLLNGRRFASNLEGIVDLNNIPIAVIKRIEVLKDGASSIYGSDAIAGVVNIITRDDFEGLQANAYIGQYASDNDGEIQSYDFSMGTTSDRGSVFFNASYVKQEPVFAGDRRISAEPVFGTGLAFGSTGTAQGRVGAAVLGSFGLTTDPGAQVCSGPNGQLPPCDPAAFRPGDFGFGAPGVGTDRFNFAPDNYSLTPQERTSIFTQGAYDVTDDVRMTVEATYNERQSSQLLAPTPLFLGQFSPGSFAGTIGVDAENPFNPFGVDLNASSWVLGRRLVEAGPRIFRQEVDSYRFGLGFQGSFLLWNRYFDWDVSYVYGEISRSDSTTGRVNLQRLKDSLSAECVSGEIEGCVPVNLFGGIPGNPNPSAGDPGSITQAMLDYILYTENEQRGNQLRNYTANVTGELFEMPAGPLSFAVGYEYRQEEGFDSPDSLVSAGITSGFPRQPAQGDFSVDELYVELAVPIFSGATLAERLDLSLSTRVSDYETFGETTNSKIGIEWQPIDDLLLRGTFSEGFRAPSIIDLVFPGADGTFFVGQDPCSVDTDGDNVPDTNPRLPGCEGVPDGDLTGEFALFDFSPNPDLQPETADSVTLGLVYSPAWLDGLDLTVDYYKIELEGSITSPGIGTAINLCANTGTVFCDTVTRDPATGRLASVILTPINLGGSEVEGVDFLLSYNFSETPWGYFRVLWDGAYQGTNDNTVVAGDGSGVITVSNLGINAGVFDRIGFESIFPRWKSNLNLQWSLGDWEANWGMQYIHGTVELCQGFLLNFDLCNVDIDGDGDFEGRSIGSTTYHDVQVSYFVAEFDARITAGVQNVFDKGPPFSPAGFADGYNRAQFRVPGRFPYVRVTVDF